MTLEQLEKTLPNGLHDAYLRALAIDYVAREARLDLDIDTSDESHERLRSGLLTLSGLVFCLIDPPDSTYEFDDAGPLWIDAVPLSALNSLPRALPLPLQEGIFGHCLFVHDWNSFIYLAARDACLEWTGEETEK